MAAGPTIVAKFVADTSQMTNQVDKASASAGSRITNFAKNAAIALGSTFAVQQVVAFGKASVEAAAADAEAQSKLAQTLKNVTGATSAQIAANEKYISGLSKQTAIADDDLRPAMDKLVRGFGSVEEAQKALALATDVSAGSGKDLSTVTEAMMKAANGQTGALSRLGIETKNTDGSAKSLDQIMSTMSQTFKGQASAAADSTAGKMRAAKVQFGEFQETIGNALIPVLATLASIFMNQLLPALKGIGSWIADNKVWFEALGIALGILGTIVLVTMVPAFIAWAVAAGAVALELIIIYAPIAALIAIVTALAYVIIRNWDTIVAATKATWNAVLGAIKWVWDWIKNNWPLLLAIIAGPIGIAATMIIRNWDTIKAAATAVWQWVSGKFQALADFIGGIVGAIARSAAAVADAIKKPINAVIGLWNGLEFRVPSLTLPKVEMFGKTIGGQTIGGQTIGFPDLPMLAGGGVLTAPTLFIGGEAGTEIVAPEDMLRAIIGEESGGHYTLNIYPRTADAADIAYGFRRLELLAGVA